jgi:hypothetical protein
VLAAQDLGLQHITNILWAVASFGRCAADPGMMRAFVSEIRARFHSEEFNSQQLANMVWALSVLQARHSRTHLPSRRAF